jgi:hypothetical protein
MLFFSKASKFFKSLSPKRRIAAIVDAVFDRMNDKYTFKGKVRIVEGGFEFEGQFVDIDPASTIDLPEEDD